MIHFENEQWKVDDEAVEAKGAHKYYWFALDRTQEMTTRNGRELYDWPVHMAEKLWVDLSLFNQAFEFALRKFAAESATQVNEDMLVASYAEGERIRREAA